MSVSSSCTSASRSSSPAVNGYSAGFHGFTPDPTTDVADEFKRLTIHQGWSEKSKKQGPRRARFYAAEFERYYGNDENKLQGWQDLCEEVVIEPIPTSITQCKKALRGANINLCNLMDHRRDSNIELIHFPNRKALREYTRNGRIFPKAAAKHNGFIKALLIHIF